MSTRSVALLRGINVGKSPRIGMADLRELFEGLGLIGVRTYLQSGNVVYEGRVDAAALESAVSARFGVSPRVLIVSAAAFRTIAQGNPIRDRGDDPSRMFTTFFEHVPASLDPGVDLGDELLVLTKHAAYNWIPAGAMDTRVPVKFWKSLGLITVRNQRTVDMLDEWLHE